mgnify:CR=1 FL=1
MAPIYRRYDLAVRLVQGDRTHIHKSSQDILKWLPGDIFVRDRAFLPKDFGEGKVDVSVGLMDPRTQKPRVRFAVEETDADGWVHLGKLNVVPPR